MECRFCGNALSTENRQCLGCGVWKTADTVSLGAPASGAAMPTLPAAYRRNAEGAEQDGPSLLVGIGGAILVLFFMWGAMKLLIASGFFAGLGYVKTVALLSCGILFAVWHRGFGRD